MYREREIGTYESDSEINYRIIKYFAEEKGIDVSKLERIAGVALSRFPELMLGEHVTLKEIKNRLKQLKEAGYDVKPYSRLPRKEAQKYLREIRREITSQLRNGFLSKIERHNRQAQDEVYLLR